jgi:hypothetical protein
VQAVSQHLDLPRLRESMKVQLVAASAVELSRHKSRALQIARAVPAFWRQTRLSTPLSRQT